MASKKTSSRGKSAAASEKERKNREAHSRQQFWAIVVFAAAVFILATTLIEGQNVWNWIHNFFLGMFGWSAYLIAPLLFYISIMTTLDKPIGLVGHKVWQTMLLICLLSGATQVFGSGIPNGNLIEKFLALFQNGIDGHGGGAVSGIFGLPLLYWFGPTGAKVTMVLLIFVVIMVLTGGTLVGLYQSAKKPMKKMEEVYVAHSEIREQQRQLRQEQMEQEQNKPHFNINIPVAGQEAPDDEPPLLIEGGFNPSSFFSAKRKKEQELQQMQQAQQEDTRKGRAAIKEKLAQERAEQKRQEEERARQIAQQRDELQEAVGTEAFWNPPSEEDLDSGTAASSNPETGEPVSSPYLDDLINRVASGKPQLAKEDQTVLHTLKSNMPIPPVRPVADSQQAQRTMKLFEETLGDVQQTGLSWEDTPDEDDDLIAPEDFHFGEHFVEAEPQLQAPVEETPQPQEPAQEPPQEPAASFDPDNIHLEDEPEVEELLPTPERKQPSHEIIEVSPDEIKAQGMSLEGVSHSADQPEPEEPEEPEEPPYIPPPIDILNEIEKPNEENLQEELRSNAEKLVSTLQSFGVQTRIIDIARGPAVTRYELQPSAGVKISKITNLADDIALNLAAVRRAHRGPHPQQARRRHRGPQQGWSAPSQSGRSSTPLSSSRPKARWQSPWAGTSPAR